MEKLLLEIKKAVEDSPPEKTYLQPDQIVDFETRYDAVIEAGLKVNPLAEPDLTLPKKRGKPKKHPARNLVDRHI
jgi:hypothetical protein